MNNLSNIYKSLATGTILFILLFIGFEFLLNNFTSFISDYSIENDYSFLIHPIALTTVSVIPSLFAVYLFGGKGLVIGAYMGFIFSCIALFIDKLFFNQYFGSNHLSIVAYSFSDFFVPSVLAGGVGELLHKSKNAL